MAARLVYRDAKGREVGVDLPRESIYIGRAVDCAVRTDDAMVSRQHAMVSFADGRFVIEDLGSANGTHVNDQRIQRREVLAHGDVVRCGNLWMRFVEETPQAAPRARAEAPSGPRVSRPPTPRAGVASPLPSPMSVLDGAVREPAQGGESSRIRPDGERTAEIQRLRQALDEANAEIARLRQQLGQVRGLVGELQRSTQERCAEIVQWLAELAGGKNATGR